MVNYNIPKLIARITSLELKIEKLEGKVRDMEKEVYDEIDGKIKKLEQVLISFLKTHLVYSKDMDKPAFYLTLLNKLDTEELFQKEKSSVAKEEPKEVNSRDVDRLIEKHKKIAKEPKQECNCPNAYLEGCVVGKRERMKEKEFVEDLKSMKDCLHWIKGEHKKAYEHIMAEINLGIAKYSDLKEEE